jgi:uncharacterized protein
VKLFILTMATLYVVAAAVLFSIQRRLIFFPWAGVPTGEAEAAGMMVVSTTAADGIAVRHWYSAPRGQHRVVVLFHGNGGGVGDLVPWADRFRARGYGIVLADYRGYSGIPHTK